LFSGSEGGAESWAILSSIVNTAKLHELDPQVYLTDVLERIVTEAGAVQEGHAREGQAAQTIEQAQLRRSGVAEGEEARSRAILTAIGCLMKPQCNNEPKSDARISRCVFGSYYVVGSVICGPRPATNRAGITGAHIPFYPLPRRRGAFRPRFRG
jgi:hypothetical protein